MRRWLTLVAHIRTSYTIIRSDVAFIHDGISSTLVARRLRRGSRRYAEGPRPVHRPRGHERSLRSPARRHGRKPSCCPRTATSVRVDPDLPRVPGRRERPRRFRGPPQCATPTVKTAKRSISTPPAPAWTRRRNANGHRGRRSWPRTAVIHVIDHRSSFPLTTLPGATHPSPPREHQKRTRQGSGGEPATLFRPINLLASGPGSRRARSPPQPIAPSPSRRPFRPPCAASRPNRHGPPAKPLP